MHRVPRLLVVSVLLLGDTGGARATDVPIVGRKLVAISNADRAKVTFVAKDPSITKGAGSLTDGSFSATLDVAYDGVSGAFTMPAPVWRNTEVVAKYKNNAAPTGGSVQACFIRPGLWLKLVARSLGDTPLDISNAPSGPVYVAETLVNDGETIRLCTQFAGCVHRAIAGGTGYKLSCKGNSSGDVACMAATPPSTCTDGAMRCNGTDAFDTCDHGTWVTRQCAPGTACAALSDTTIVCAWPDTTSTTVVTTTTTSSTTSTTAPACRGGAFTVTVSGSAEVCFDCFLNNTAWTLTGASAALLDSGGPYPVGNGFMSTTTTNDVPLTFEINASNNVAHFSIECDGAVVASGTNDGFILAVTNTVSVSRICCDVGTCDADVNCDDGNPCTTDTCSNGTCVHSYGCDDGVDCTVDFCDPSVGCRNVVIESFCDDGEDCTVDTCDLTVGTCTHEPVVCPDGTNSCMIAPTCFAP